MLKTQRDALIIKALSQFKVCSRNQIAFFACRENTNPVNVVNRVLRRMYLDGKLLQVPRERDKCFLYMPNPAILHHRSVKIDHHLKIVDFYIHAGCPEHFTIEPKLGDYEPDVYMKDKVGNHICVEIQLTPISSRKMQKKIDQFVATHGKKHQAKVMLLVSDNEYSKITVPEGFKLIRIPVPKEPYV